MLKTQYFPIPSMLLVLFLVLFGPLSVKIHKSTSFSTDIRMDLLEQIGKTFCNYQRSKLRNNFFTDHHLLERIQSILDQASSNILEKLKAFTEDELEAMDIKLDDLKNDAMEQIGQRDFTREYVNIKRGKWFEIDQLKQNFNQKLKLLKQEKIFGPANLIHSKGSRKIKSKTVQ